ncbi:hypothetical protein LCGC14_2460670 [marine sediment metagenome]|uniref:Uncharacterized protein n=1 Tax=marine sediment metagenome TaxID=412755 RepID=A0A0F9DQH2_9ZZZZ
MQKIIKVKIKNVYGNNLCYPLTYAKELETLTGNKTLTARNVEALKGLGFSFEQELTRKV